MKNIIFYEKIAVGGMSTIYKGKYNDVDVVIKKLHSHLAEDKIFLKRFKKEAEILGKLRHPNIIRFISFERIEDDYFLILEFVEGKSLDDILKKRKIPVKIVLKICLDIARGINYAHRNGIIHRDIKPSNILISKDGVCKILDFGLAYEEGIRFTDPGVYIGTPAYIAPEVLSGKNYSFRSDVFSFGVLFYELISGSNPFYAKTPYETINNILYKEPERLNVDEELNDFIFKMLCKEPEKRIKDFGEIIEGIKRFNICSKKEFLLWLNEKIEIKDEIVLKEREFPSLIFIPLLLFIIIISSFFFNRYIKREEKIIKEEEKPVVLEEIKPETSIVLQKEEKSKIEIRELKKVDSGYVFFDIKGIGDIFIDGEFFVNTPFIDKIKMKSGEHTISIKSKEGFVIERKIVVKSDTIVNIYENISSSFLKLRVEPWGYVFIDGENKGMTPLTPIKLTPGKHRLTITNPKYNEWSNEIEIKGGETLFLFIELK
uniref:Serine/threonine protein kinase n=1 Tax=candidate division WOR-3 bacterium TaxID=2052148 RepID=A0A7C4U6P9_UNCW3